jgi:hypothetical protein
MENREKTEKTRGGLEKGWKEGWFAAPMLAGTFIILSVLINETGAK